MRKRSVTIDLQVELEKAVEWLLTPGNAWGNNDYITASDLEQRIRGRASEILDGAEYGSRGQQFSGHGIQIRGLDGMSLLSHCRDYLINRCYTGELEMHNFGRGHVSGARFRKAGSGPSEKEQKTVESNAKKQKRGTPVHLRKDGTRATRVCETKRQAKASSWGRRRDWRMRFTDDPEKVTCRNCLAKIRQMNEIAPPEVVQETL